MYTFGKAIAVALLIVIVGFIAFIGLSSSHSKTREQIQNVLYATSPTPGLTTKQLEDALNIFGAKLTRNIGKKMKAGLSEAIPATSSCEDANCNSNIAEDYTRLLQERNEQSRLLNSVLEKRGQLECQLQKNGGESTVGGWCTKDNLAGAHVQDEPLAGAISQRLKGKTMGSFGDGSGAYNHIFTKIGAVKSYTSYDGNPNSFEATNGTVAFLDLSVPQYGLPVYDWIMSLEVAEHIPEQYEAIYLDNIARYAREGTILSWAAIGQGGRSHVNNKPDEWVRAELAKRGLVRDETMSAELKAAASFPWLRANTNAYVRVKEQ